MNRTAFIIASVVAASWAGTASAQQVSLTLKDGRVTLITQNASVRQVLAEWERQGHVRIVGADRLPAGQPLTLSLVDVSERQALDIVLRGLPGYLAVDRREPLDGASRYDRLMLLARTSTPVTGTPQTAAAVAAPTQQPAFAQPMEQSGDGGSVDVQPFEDANAEPPMPTAPVVNPYPSGAGGAGGPGGMNAPAAGPTVLSSGSPSNGAPETQFDYANPQRYFEQMRQRQMQQQQGAQPTGATPPAVAPYPGSTLDTAPTTTPAGVPTATGTSARPGIAPAPTTPPQQQQFFNPYNLPPEQLNGNPSAVTTPPGSAVEPDRAKYANPYVPTPAPTRPPE